MNNGPLSKYFFSASFAGLLSFFNHFYSACGHLFTSLTFISSCVAAEAPDRVAVAWSCSQTLLIRSDTGEDGQKDGRTHFAETEIKIDWRSEEQKQWHTVPLTQAETTLFNIFNNHACSSTHLSHVSCRHGDVFMHAFIIHCYTWEVKIREVSVILFLSVMSFDFNHFVFWQVSGQTCCQFGLTEVMFFLEHFKKVQYVRI